MTSRLTISPLTTTSSTWATWASTRLRSSSISLTTGVAESVPAQDVAHVQQRHQGAGVGGLRRKVVGVAEHDDLVEVGSTCSSSVARSVVEPGSDRDLRGSAGPARAARAYDVSTVSVEPGGA